MKKRILSFITMLVVLVNIFAAMPVTYAANKDMAEPGTNAVKMLDGKRILFVGCSYTYYGGTVLANAMTRTYEERVKDPGFFYQLCKEHGAEVDVTDWTFGGHALKNLFCGYECTNSRCAKNPPNHLEDLKDRKYDYVVIQDVMNKISEGELDKTDYEGKINIYVDMVKQIMELFRAENPDVKFYYGIYTGMYTSANNVTEALSQSLERIQELGVTMLDWGTLGYDVMNGVTEVPNATQEYDRYSFLVGTDTYHQNILSGYLYALMVYCAITGETAVGQPYGFCYDENHEAYPAGKQLKLETYIDKYYTPNGSTTNFPEIFASEADMKGLQELANEYMNQEKKPWKKWLHTVTLEENGGADAEDVIILHGHTVYEDLPDALTCEGYSFDGWYKDAVLTQLLEETDTVTEDTTLYAAWKEKTDADSRWENPFDDVNENDWFCDSVKYVNQSGLMQGISATEFSPAEAVTRAALVTTLYRNEGETPVINKSIPFSDIDLGAYYANAVIWAQQNNIVTGVTETEFCPDGKITREQLAAIMYRYAQFKGYDVTVSESADSFSYTDKALISEYALIPMQYAAERGIIQGKTETTINPSDETTRSEIAAILQRFIEGSK